MSTTTHDPDDRSRYEIRVRGHLDDRWSTWFEGLALSHEGDGTTVIRCRPTDQAGLHGLLRKVRDLGLPLVSVTRTGPDEPPPDGPPPGASIDRSSMHDERDPTS